MANARKSSRHNQEKILFILMSLIIVGLIVSGYFLFVRKILPELNSPQPQNAAIASNSENPQAPESGKIASDSSNEFIPPDELHTLKIYFPGVGKDNLLNEVRNVRKRTMLIAQARQIVETLIEGPVAKDVYQAIPKGTKLRGLFFEAGLFTVDLSREFLAIQSSGASEEVLAVYSIVNSLTELDPKAKIKFLVNGTEQETGLGHVDLSQNFSRFEELINR